jgi:hypothetical protein
MRCKHIEFRSLLAEPASMLDDGQQTPILVRADGALCPV